MSEQTTAVETQNEEQRDAQGRTFIQHVVKFRKRTIKTKDAAGNEVVETRERDPIPVTVAAHTRESVLAIMVDGSETEKDFIVQLVNDQIFAAIKSVFDENETAQSQADVDLSSCTLEAIAKDSGSSGYKPTKEEFEAFVKHYVHAMPSLGVKTEAAKLAAAEFMMGRFPRTAYNEGALKSLRARLEQYVANVVDSSDHDKATTYLLRRIEKLMEAISGDVQY